MCKQTKTVGFMFLTFKLCRSISGACTQIASLAAASEASASGLRAELVQIIRTAQLSIQQGHTTTSVFSAVSWSLQSPSQLTVLSGQVDNCSRVNCANECTISPWQCASTVRFFFGLDDSAGSYRSPARTMSGFWVREAVVVFSCWNAHTTPRECDSGCVFSRFDFSLAGSRWSPASCILHFLGSGVEKIQYFALAFV
jgi:hypothetical protein